jgi:hypothetical protein
MAFGCGWGEHMKITWGTPLQAIVCISAFCFFTLNSAQAAWPPKPGECNGYVPPPPGYDTKPPPLMPGRSPKPLTYRDAGSGIVFYVESDGRHLAAIGPSGSLLWVRNPFVDQRLCPYRNDRPIIVRIEPVSKGELSMEPLRRRPGARFIRVWFDSSQFGAVDMKNGDFLLQGQN